MSASTTPISIDSAAAYSRNVGSPTATPPGIRTTRGVLFSVLLAVPFWAMIGLLFF
jgi:hypothetical protein